MKTALPKLNSRKKATSYLKKLLISGLIFIAASQQAKAQDKLDDGETKKVPYVMAVGFRYPYAISSKFINGLDAVETFISFSSNWTRATCIYELNKELSDGFSAFAGAGGHITVWKKVWKVKHSYYDTDIALGFDAILGVDYKVQGLPIDISIDWQPNINAYGYKQLNFANGGINLRFAF